MYSFPKVLQKLVSELTRLPSIGEKTALRLAYHLVQQGNGQAHELAQAIEDAAAKVCLCQCCFHLSEEALCSICRNAARDKSIICVVEKPADVVAIERVGEFRGIYHVLHGLWAPLKGLGPDQIRLKELVARVKAGGVSELILATGSTVEGDATALYIARLFSELGVKSTRLAQGMPKGGELEYADEITLSRAFAGRNSLEV